MSSIWTRWFGVAAFVLMASLVVSDAQASRIVLLTFSGRKGDVLRAKVAQSLETAGHTVVLSKTRSKGPTKAQIRKLAKSSEAAIVVGGSVTRRNLKSWSLALKVNDGKAGTPLGSAIEFKSHWLPGLTKELTDNVSRELEAALEQSSDPPAAVAKGPVWDADKEAQSAEVEPTAADVAPSPEPEAAASDNSLFEVNSDVIADRDAKAAEPAEDDGMVVRLRARAGLVHRSLDFSDDIYSRLRKQQANIWVYHVEGALYPFERPIGESLGLIASFESVFSGNVRDADQGSNFPVVFQELFGGVRARQKLGAHEIGFDLTFGRMLAGLEDTDVDANIPDMSYTVLRSVLDFSLDLGRLRAVGSAGFRLPLGYGEVSNAEWFPRIGGYGVEASVGAEYPLSRSVSLELTGGLRRYLLEMNSEPEDAMGGVAEVAGGAVDLYLAGYFGMSFRL